MLSSLGRFRGLPIPRLFGLVRLAVELALIVALLGPSTPTPTPTSTPTAERAPRQPAHPRYHSVDPTWLAEFPGGTPQVLDTETGALTPFPIPSARFVGPLGCSPWRDGAGRYHMAVLCLDSAGDARFLMRCTFPAGQVLDRVKVDVLTSRRPCWSPDRSDRLLFAGSDRRLYLFDLPEVGGTWSPEPAPPRALRWQIEPPGVGEVWFQDPCWPGAPALGGRLLVALSCVEDASRPDWKPHLWWLRLGPDGGSIVAAERAIEPGALGRSLAPAEEISPNVGMTRDGTPLLAVLVRDRSEAALDLWVIPIAPAAQGRGPRVLGPAGRRLAEGCAAMTPAFSADGRWVYAWRWVDGKIRTERLAVPVAADAPPEGAE